VPAAAGFGALRHLLVRGNPLSSWRSIDALDTYPSLREARLAELPLTAEMSSAVARRCIIARVGGLEALNGSEVRKRERDDAERFYLRQVAQGYPEGGLPAGALTDAAGGEGAKLELPEDDAWQAIQREHPRWRALLLKHGEQRVMQAAGGAAGGVLSAELIEVTMRATAAEAAAIPAVTRRLPGGLPLKSVKLIACQLFKVEPTKQQLLYCPPGADKDIPEPLDDDLKRLCDFGVASGGTIVVDEL